MPLRLNRTGASPPRPIRGGISVSAETGCKHLRICRRDRRQFPAPHQTRMKKAILEERLSRPQPWKSPERRPVRAPVRHDDSAARKISVQESGSITPAQSTPRRAAIRSAQLAAATNARPSQQPAFLPIPPFEFVALSGVHLPNEYKTHWSPVRLRANAYRPTVI